MPTGQLPHIRVAGGRLEPQQIGIAVAVEVGRADRLPSSRMRADAHAAGPLAVHDLPDFDIVRDRIEPGDVARAVAIEIAGSDGLVAGRMRARAGAAGPLAIDDLPDV